MSDSFSKNILHFIQGKLTESELKKIIQKEKLSRLSVKGNRERKNSPPENGDL